MYVEQFLRATMNLVPEYLYFPARLDYRPTGASWRHDGLTWICHREKEAPLNASDRSQGNSA